MIWDTQHQMRLLSQVLHEEYELDLAGWVIRAATGISADGLVIVGVGINPDGNTEGWIADMRVPEPPTLAMVLLALAYVFMRKRVVKSERDFHPSERGVRTERRTYFRQDR